MGVGEVSAPAPKRMLVFVIDKPIGIGTLPNARGKTEDVEARKGIAFLREKRENESEHKKRKRTKRKRFPACKPEWQRGSDDRG
jgi:hypothetical protein